MNRIFTFVGSSKVGVVLFLMQQYEEFIWTIYSVKGVYLVWEKLISILYILRLYNNEY